MKPWYTSKTLWINVLAAIALIIQTQTGFVIDPDAQAGVLAVVNLVLRLITGQPISWRNDTSNDDDIAGPRAMAGFARLRLLMLLAAISTLFLLTACAGINQSQAKQDVATGVQVVGIALDTAMGLCKAGVIPAETCMAIAAGDLTYDVIEQVVEAAQ